MPKTPPIPRTGAGALIIGRERLPVAFSIVFTRKVSGGRSASGSISGAPDDMRRVFHACHGRLVLDDGAELDVDVIAHSEGAATAYFESR